MNFRAAGTADLRTTEPDFLYPPIEPFERSRLPVDALHSLYFEQSGNSAGFPVLFLHGGPGSHTRPPHRRYFDPAFYRIVLFDQRGCGQSTPAGAIEANTTWHLVEDIEALRKHLRVERWLLFGGSWGSALALAYAQTHPGRVAGLIMRGVFLGTQAELEWYLEGLGRFVPEARHRLLAHVGGDPIARYHALVTGTDPGAAVTAARAWVAYEEAAMSLGSGNQPQANGEGDQAALARARVQLHYLLNHCFLAEGALLDGCWRVAKVPTIIVQGRLDMVCPPHTAFALARRLAGAEIRIVEGGGHSATQPALAQALRAAADDIRHRLDPGTA